MSNWMEHRPPDYWNQEFFKDSFKCNYKFFTKDHLNPTAEDFEDYKKFWLDTPKANILKFIKSKQLLTRYEKAPDELEDEQVLREQQENYDKMEERCQIETTSKEDEKNTISEKSF